MFASFLLKEIKEHLINPTRYELKHKLLEIEVPIDLIDELEETHEDFFFLEHSFNDDSFIILITDNKDGDRFNYISETFKKIEYL